MELFFRYLILNWHPRKRKIAVPRLKKKMRCYYLKIDDDALFIIGRATFEKNDMRCYSLKIDDDALFKHRSP